MGEWYTQGSIGRHIYPGVYLSPIPTGVHIQGYTTIPTGVYTGYPTIPQGYSLTRVYLRVVFSHQGVPLRCVTCPVIPSQVCNMPGYTLSGVLFPPGCTSQVCYSHQGVPLGCGLLPGLTSRVWAITRVNLSGVPTLRVYRG